MTRKKIRKIILISLSALAFLFIILCIHIYVMMKPHPASATTLAMARIDFKQNINQADADKITAWLYSHQGVQHVLCNQKTNIAVFTFYPAKVSADKLTGSLSSSLNYKAVRYMPTEEEMMKGCPVANSSFTYKVYDVMKKIL
jgi:uncharacterized membrane protein YvbJ